MGRQLLWVLAGLLCLPLLLVLTAPELLQARPSAAFGLLALVLVAGVPGLVALLVVAIRKGRDRAPSGSGASSRSRTTN